MWGKKLGGIRGRLVTFITGTIAILSILLYFYSINQIENRAQADFNKQLKSIHNRLLAGAESLFLTDEKASYYEAVLSRAIENNEIAYAVVKDSTGKTINSFNLAVSPKNTHMNQSPVTEARYDEDEITNVVQPIYNNKKIVGGVYFGVSRDQLNGYIIGTRIKFAMIYGGVILVAFLLALLINYVMREPLKEILQGSEKILSGDYKERINLKTGDQVSSIANMFNAFAERMEELDAQVIHLNEKLKTAFRNKLGELNLEINQRRLAEESLRKSEEQFRLLFDIAPIGMAITSPVRKIIKVNSAFERTLGYSAMELENLNTYEITYYEDRAKDEEIYKGFIDGHIKSKNYEKRYVTKSGKIIDVVNRIILHRDEKGKPVQFIEQAIDITEQKKMQDDLIYAKEKAEESDMMKSAFLAQMSHEIRTPLNVILAASNIFEEELGEHLDEDSREIIDSVKSAGKRLMRTIDLILNMSAIQTGKYKPDFEKVDLNVEVKKLVEEFRTICAEKKLALSFSSHDDSAIVKVDRYTVQQIFQNLISNAVKYTRKGSVDVVVYKTDRVCVEIKDTGIGMSKEYQNDLFHPFSQEDVGQRREFEGNGLGLALVKKYIEINNATIKVESEKDRGSTFTVIF